MDGSYSQDVMAWLRRGAEKARARPVRFYATVLAFWLVIWGLIEVLT